MLSGDSKFPSSGVFNDGQAEIYARGFRAVEASRRHNRPLETLRERTLRWGPHERDSRDVYVGKRGDAFARVVLNC